MIAQYSQAALVSEMKRLAVARQRRLDPLVGAMQEDHVSMGWHAARKLRAVARDLTRMLAIELAAPRAASTCAAARAVARHGRALADRVQRVPGVGRGTTAGSSPEIAAVGD